MDHIDDGQMMRLAGRHLLDQVTVARFGLDLIDALIVCTVSHANVVPIVRDPDLQRRYATFDNVPPDEARRPISINAVAQSLDMPFETVRRRIAKMSLVGIFKTARQGVYVPTAFCVGGPHRTSMEGAYARTRALYLEAIRLGWDEAVSSDVEPWMGAEPLRLVSRVSSEYLLRLVQIVMEEAKDPVAATVWLALFCDDAAVADRGGRPRSNGQPGKPLSMSALARRLRLPTETTRRRVHALLTAGLCVDTGSSVVVDASVLRRPGIQRLLVRNRQDLRRMFTTLAQYGIVQSWDNVAASRSAAA
jgi:hypothetical protein